MNDTAERLRAVIAAQQGRERALVLGLVLTAVWLLMVLLFWLAGPEDPAPSGGLSWLMSAVGVVMPVMLIWIAVGLARAVAELQEEARLLRARLDTLRSEPAAHDAARTEAAGPAVPRPSPRATAARPAETRQSALPLEAPAPVEVPVETLIVALNFPDGPDDQHAIQALRTALSDPETARVIRAAQDVVTLLAKQGIYMDDLSARPAPVDAWRRFAAGGRGQQVAALAAVSDPDVLEMAGELMRGDEVFRDAAHHFLRQYDRSLSRIADELTDAGIAAITDTRSGRAFTLLAQVAGMFGQPHGRLPDGSEGHAKSA